MKERFGVLGEQVFEAQCRHVGVEMLIGYPSAGIWTST
jgi:hypothetical protein